MNAHDAILWKSGREKVAAGRPLTAAESEVLTYFGGAGVLKTSLKTVHRPALAIERKWIRGGLTYGTPAPIARRSE